MPSSWRAAPTSTIWKSGCPTTSDDDSRSPHCVSSPPRPEGTQSGLGRPGAELTMFELRLLCPEERVEPVSDALEALDALSVSVEDADARTDAEQALFGEPGMP